MSSLASLLVPCPPSPFNRVQNTNCSFCYANHLFKTYSVYIPDRQTELHYKMENNICTGSSQMWL
ncbi:unnamed protein product [Schistosoma mansoni]|uniref:Smp_204400 n=1 Tax=Schistosoma mansoni TaxID=6183 RepID=UPI00022C86E9|nr:unnamed protein product [Schistosoma mansoni]|eukprot:XP_018645860.1 unnamed protein product [Schistosoma mansoni]